MKTIEERVKILEKKVLVLEGGNPTKKDLENPYKSYKVSEKDIETPPK